MNWPAEIERRLSTRGEPADPDVVLELAQHAQSAYETACADGLSGDEAIARVKELLDLWCADPARLMGRPRRPLAIGLDSDPPFTSRGRAGFWQDVRYGMRLFRRQPGFGLVAAWLIALGVGTATTLLSLTYTVLFAPLPWPDADRIVRLSEDREGATRHYPDTLTNATFFAWQENPATIESLASYGEHTVTATASGRDPERFTYLSASASLFAVLDARPELGALFTPADEPDGRNHVLVISHGLWQRRFGGRADVIGSTIDLNSDPYVVIGVMPRDFYFPTRDIQAWSPERLPPLLDPNNPDSRHVSVRPAIARLKPGVSTSQASAEATALGAAAPDLRMTGIAMFGTQGKPRVTATKYLDAITADVRPALYIVGMAVVLLLATVIANIAGMQLARSMTRRREVAIRAALGATPARLARQLLVENLAVGVAGGVAGLVVAAVLYRTMPSLLPAGFPRLGDVHLTWRIGAIAFVGALAATAIFGAIPAIVARKLQLVETLVEDSLAPAGGGVRSRIGRMRALIMSGQVALAALLLVGASLLGRSFVSMLHVDRGYDPRNLLTAIAPMGLLKYTGPQRAQLLDTIVDRLSRTPGVVAAAGSTALPLWPNEYVMSFRWGGHGPTEGRTANASVRYVSPGYFATLGMRVVEGRVFSDEDSATSEPVMVVNRQFARKYFPDRVLDERLPIHMHGSQDDTQFARIVGVVDNVRMQSASEVPQPEVFVSYRQRDSGMDLSAPIIVVRTSGDPAALTPLLRQIAREANPQIALSSVMTMDERLMTSLAEPRLYAVLLGTFAVSAMVLCGVGLFGVLSYSVAQRTRELGIRAVLGATPAEIAGLVARQGLAIAGAGAIVGLGAAFLLVTTISKLLFGISARDPVSFVAVPIVLAIVAGMASYLPARRAAQIDPLKAIKR